MFADDNALLILMELDEEPFNSVPVVVCGIDSNWQLVERNRGNLTFKFPGDLQPRALSVIIKTFITSKNLLKEKIYERDNYPPKVC